MIYSPNLSIIIKAIDKISSKLARDFMELESLQNNNFSAIKFSNSCYQRIQEDLTRDLGKIHRDYNFEFSNGKKLINNKDAEYNYIICPIDGLLNLSRAIPYFTTFIALEHTNTKGDKETIATVIGNIANNELYFCEKGKGSFLSNRKIRTSKRELKDHILCSISNIDLINNPFVQRIKNSATIKSSNCFSLDLAYLATGKIDLCIFEAKDENFVRSLLPIARESGGIIEKKNDLILVSNGKIDLNFLKIK